MNLDVHHFQEQVGWGTRLVNTNRYNTNSLHLQTPSAVVTTNQHKYKSNICNSNVMICQRSSLPGVGLQVQIQQKLVIFAISKCRSEAKRAAASKYNAIQIHHIYKDNIWKSKIGWQAHASFNKWRIACKYNGNTKIIFAKSMRGCRWEAKFTKRRADRGGWEAGRGEATLELPEASCPVSQTRGQPIL